MTLKIHEVSDFICKVHSQTAKMLCKFQIANRKFEHCSSLLSFNMEKRKLAIRYLMKINMHTIIYLIGNRHLINCSSVNFYTARFGNHAWYDCHLWYNCVNNDISKQFFHFFKILIF